MWARIDSGSVAEITDVDPSGRFHRSIEWVECSPDCAVGERYVDGTFLPPPDPVWSEEDERLWRDSTIANTDYLAMPDYPLTVEARDEILAYRQELRDWPENEMFPSVDGRPTSPDWLK